MGRTRGSVWLPAKINENGKPCVRCGSTRRYTGQGQCVPCHLANARRWRSENRDRILAYRQTEVHRSRHYRSRYGVTREQFEAALLAQENKCAICSDELVIGTSRNLDHDHATGVFRGILCAGCNRGLGQFRDNPEILERAIGYLRKKR